MPVSPRLMAPNHGALTLIGCRRTFTVIVNGKVTLPLSSSTTKYSVSVSVTLCAEVGKPKATLRAKGKSKLCLPPRMILPTLNAPSAPVTDISYKVEEMLIECKVCTIDIDSAGTSPSRCTVTAMSLSK